MTTTDDYYYYYHHYYFYCYSYYATTTAATTTTTTTNPGTAALSPRAILPLGHGRCPGRVQNFSEAGKQQRRRPNLELALEG